MICFTLTLVYLFGNDVWALEFLRNNKFDGVPDPGLVDRVSGLLGYGRKKL